MTNIAIFASGAGSNAQKIIERFKDHPSIRVRLVFSNKAEAGVLAIADEYNISTLVMSNTLFKNTEIALWEMEKYEIDYIILAGFLLLVPEYIIRHYHNKIINIHPALLPKYGGKGMYGMRVHEAVRAKGETETGITIHYANAHYDEGSIIFQAKCQLTPSDSAEEIAQKVHALEHIYFPEVIESVIMNAQKHSA